MPVRVFFRAVLSILWLILAAGPKSLPAQEPEKKTFTPLWSRVMLCDGPDCCTGRPAEGDRTGELLIGEGTEAGVLRVDGRQVELRDSAGAILWRHQAKESVELSFLAIVDETIFLAEQNTSYVKRTPRGGTLRRLQLSDGTKLESLTIPTDPNEKGTSEVLSALPMREGLIVLSETIARPRSGDAFRKYRVSHFGEELLWSQSFDANAALPFARQGPDGLFVPAGKRGIQPLTRVGNTVVVCGGLLEDILALDVATGKTRWRISRLWEYRKGYVGPSVHSHFIGRHGEFGGDSERGVVSDPEAWHVEPGRDAKALRRSILAGPVAVPLADDPRRHSLFIATSQLSDEKGTTYLSECVVYELNDSGHCLGMVKLPHKVDGRQFSVVGDSVVWCTKGLDWARLFVSSRRDRGIGGGPGNPDNTIDLEWHPRRRGRATVSQAAGEAWFRQEGFAPIALLSGRMMLSITVGGYIEEKASHVLRFPLKLTDLETGQYRTLLVKLPFEGNLAPHENNLPNAEDKWMVPDQSPTAISSLDLRGNDLFVTFPSGWSSATFVFGVEDVLRPKE